MVISFAQIGIKVLERAESMTVASLGFVKTLTLVEEVLENRLRLVIREEPTNEKPAALAPQKIF